MVMADGFAWNGQTYDSLSKVAFAITGTKWNRPRFFGLRDKEDSGHEGALGQAGPLCDLYKGLHRARSGIQLAGWQHDAASAYIKSQAHAGWTLIRSRYDDGGYSGGSTDRPDLQRQLDDIRARKIDVIVVHKVDHVSGRVTTVAALCAREQCSVRQVNMTILVAFLAPTLVKPAVASPRGIGVERLRDPPIEWGRQFEALGLNPE